MYYLMELLVLNFSQNQREFIGKKYTSNDLITFYDDYSEMK